MQPTPKAKALFDFNGEFEDELCFKVRFLLISSSHFHIQLLASSILWTSFYFYVSNALWINFVWRLFFLQTGDVIVLLERVNDEWLQGELEMKVGRFPAAFVEILTPLP